VLRVSSLRLMVLSFRFRVSLPVILAHRAHRAPIQHAGWAAYGRWVFQIKVTREVRPPWTITGSGGSPGRPRHTVPAPATLVPQRATSRGVAGRCFQSQSSPIVAVDDVPGVPSGRSPVPVRRVVLEPAPTPDALGEGRRRSHQRIPAAAVIRRIVRPPLSSVIRHVQSFLGRNAPLPACRG
jgi:hypothetical protein